MIGLIAAEKSETNNLIKLIKAKIIEFNGVKYYIGTVNDKQVVICFCGVGKANASMAVTNMIINFGVDKIFNIGLAGSCKLNVKPGSIIVANALEYYDVDLTAFDYPLNQLPEEPISFQVKNEHVNELKLLISDSIVGTIATGDSIVSLKNIEFYPSLANKEVVGFDMEATAIAQICNKTKVDFMCIKLISDNVSINDSSRKQYDVNFKLLSKQIEIISLKVLEYYSK